MSADANTPARGTEARRSEADGPETRVPAHDATNLGPISPAGDGWGAVYVDPATGYRYTEPLTGWAKDGRALVAPITSDRQVPVEGVPGFLHLEGPYLGPDFTAAVSQALTDITGALEELKAGQRENALATERIEKILRDGGVL